MIFQRQNGFEIVSEFKQKCPQTKFAGISENCLLITDYAAFFIL